MKSQITRCPHFPPCPGCPLIHLPADEILRIKERRVQESLDLFPGLRNVAVKPCMPALSQTGYRTRVKFAVGQPRKDSVSIGLFLPGTHEVIDLPECRVMAPAMLPIVAVLRSIIAKAKAPIVHLDLRWSLYQSRAHVTLVVSNEYDSKSIKFLAEALMKARPEVAGVSVRMAHAGPVLRPLSGHSKLLLGDAFLIERLDKALFRLSAGSFFQADPAGALTLHGIVRRWLSAVNPARHLVDLYAGAGAFAMTLADSAKKTTAVESVRESAENARASAVLSGVSVQVVDAPAESFIQTLHTLNPDRVVLDPPRRGVDAAVLRAIGQVQPDRLAYVSCDPETLARDLAVLALFDLAVHTVIPVDLFPLTDQVEAVALIERAKKRWRPQVLYKEENLLAVEKPAHIRSTSRNASEHTLLRAVKDMLDFNTARAVYELEASVSGPVLISEGSIVPAVALEYLALVKGVPHKKGNLPVLHRRDKIRRPGEKNHYILEDVIGGYGLIKINTTSLHLHEISHQLSLIKHPVLGDTRFGDKRANRFLAETCCLARPFLHVSRISITAAEHDQVSIELPLPGELLLVCRRLKEIRDEGRRKGEDVLAEG